MPMHKNILKLQNHIKNRKSRNSNHFITHVTCGIPYLKYLYIYTYRHARYAICIYTWHTGMHQTRRGNYCSHACDFGIAQASMETMIVEFAMYWQEAPSVEAGVLLAEWYRPANRYWGKDCFSQAGFSASTFPSTYQSSSWHLPESKKKLTRQKKERLVCRQLHFTVIHNGAICDTFLIFLRPFVVFATS